MHLKQDLQSYHNKVSGMHNVMFVAPWTIHVSTQTIWTDADTICNTEQTLPNHKADNRNDVDDNNDKFVLIENYIRS